MCFGTTCYSQSGVNLVLKGDFTYQDSIQIISAYAGAKSAVEKMYTSMNSLWIVPTGSNQNKKEIRKERWENEEPFGKWLGEPEKIGMARRRINRIRSKYQHKMILVVTKENKSRCKGWISAWTIPYGKVRIRLCDDFLKYRTHLHEKTLIHELGHEIGMPFHRKIHGCWTAERAARSSKNVAKRSPENYAWLAMSFLGLECGR